MATKPAYAFSIKSLTAQMWKVVSLLDSTNVQLLCAMNRDGPRKICKVAAKIGIPASTAYLRLQNLEQWGPLSHAYADLSKLGMERAVVFLNPMLGQEDPAVKLMKSLGYWFTWGPSDGPFSQHWTLHYPRIYRQQILNSLEDGKYLHSNVIQDSQFHVTGSFHPVFPNFELFDPRTKEWHFEWQKWLASTTEGNESTSSRQLLDPESYDLLVDKIDLIIIKELEKNARQSMTDIAKEARISPQVAAYRYRRLITREFFVGNSLELQIFPPQISSTREFMVRFTKREGLDNFVAAAPRTIFVNGLAKKVKEDVLFVRTFTPTVEEGNLINFFKQLSEAGLVKEFSSVRIYPFAREIQTTSYELFDDETGWQLKSPVTSAAIRPSPPSPTQNLSN